MTRPPANRCGAWVGEEHYFNNLLPDSASIRSRIHAKFAIDSTEAFDLLEAIRRDCVGAVQLLPAGETPTGFDRIEAEPLSDRGIEELIGGKPVPGTSSRTRGRKRFSNLPGRRAGKDRPCSRLMQRLGLHTARCEILELEKRKPLAVERFDRRLQRAGWIARLSQEDFCQALGLPSTMK